MSDHRDATRDDTERRENMAYQKPTTGYMGTVLRPLPLSSANHTDITATDPEFTSVKVNRIITISALLVVLGAVAGIYFVAPWAQYSPVSYLVSLLPTGGHEHIEALYDRIPAFVLICFVLYVFMNETKQKKSNTAKGKSHEPFLRRMALHEELLFRRGAENWSLWRRSYSCILFGTIHIFNLIVPIAVAIALCGVGVLLMAVYLNEFRRSGDERRATILAAEVHTEYNKAAITLAILILIASTIYVAVILVSSIWSAVF